MAQQNAYAPEQGTTEQELMAGFQELKRVVRDTEGVMDVPACVPADTFGSDISSLSPNTILGPFFAIIRSPLSTGPITSSALTAIHNFFLHGLINTNTSSLQETLAELSNAVSSCKFEASDSSGDEVVLLKIMTVIEDAMCSGVGLVLGDIEVCEMLETVLTTSCQMRLSGALNIRIVADTPQ